MPTKTTPLEKQAPLSTQVSGSRYFFLTLNNQQRKGVYPAYGGFETCQPNYLVQRDGFGFNILELVVGGEGHVRMNGIITPLRAGSLFCYDRTTKVEIATSEQRPMAKYFIGLTGTDAPRRLLTAGIKPGEAVQLAMFPEVQRIIEELIKEGQHHRTTTERICSALAEVLILRIEDLARLSGQTGHAAEETFLRCKSLIEAQATQFTNLTDITRAVGVENSQLNRLFRRYQGLSPYQYLLHRKMALAAERLMEPNTLVKEAAAYVGFTDPYHFSRCFKKIHRVSPKEFQASRQRAY